MYRSLPSGVSKPKRSLRGLEALYIQEQEFGLKREDTIRYRGCCNDDEA